MSPHLDKKRKDGPATYAYDAMGKRTEIYDPVLGGTYEYFNGATRDSYKGGTHWTIDGGVFTYEVGSYDYGVYFGRSDHLGTPKITTNTSGTVIKTESMGPFGDGFTTTGSGISDIGFAGGDYDRSGDSNNFGARDYKPIEGRWLSPDPAGLAAADPSNPQTWNRYAYVLNNPLSFTDPTGLDCVYLNDPGDGVASIDHDSNAQECSGPDANGNPNGGYWIPGSVPDSSWVTNIDSENNQIGALSRLDNGAFGWTGSTNQLGGGWGTVGIDVSNTAANNWGPLYPPSMFTRGSNMPIVSQWRPPIPFVTAPYQPLPYKPSVGECFTNPGNAVELMAEGNGTPLNPEEHDPSAPVLVYQNTNRGMQSVNAEEAEATGNGLAILVAGAAHWFGCMAGALFGN